ncbi:MAG: trypsin-like peptidase domain-containing protein [Desulforhopalus sp.]
MKLCETCSQHLAEDIRICPSCGGRVAAGRDHIDDFLILQVLREGHASILCKAQRKGEKQPVMIRLFGPQSGVDEGIAKRLQRELDEIRNLPHDMFVAHRQIKRSSDGLWYRVSEWVDTVNWGDLLASGRLNDYHTTFTLFRLIAEALDILHRRGLFIPHLIPDDIMVVEGPESSLSAKIDYKLSRFIDPNLDQPGPQLKQLLDCHPDIIDERPLDHRSDIWSLGRIFVQVLSADFSSIDVIERIDRLALPESINALLKIMLSNDPNLRPQSMAEIAKTFARVTSRDILAVQKMRQAKTWISLPEIIRFKSRLQLVATAVILLIVIGAATVWYIIFFRRDSQEILGEYANSYAPSVAFVLVEYELLHREKTVFRNRTEGTAFLVSEDGYLLTNRHVACPWLADNQLQTAIMLGRLNGVKLSFRYQMYLWFEGQHAFRRLPDLDDPPDVTDVYDLQSAYRSHGMPRVVIAGVANPPVKTRNIVQSPLGNDFAVLKIDKVPVNLSPIPLALKLETAEVARLTPVITMGFPLGSRTQSTHVNVSVTYGHVRRSFSDYLQVDSSIYSGNSGGPVIDVHGKVIGIASAVAVQRAQGAIPVFTALSDIGLVLPINKAVVFLDDLRLGRVKWNGVLDLSLQDKVSAIHDLAREGNWQAAKKAADAALAVNLHPSLVMTSGIMDICAGQYDDARHRFNEALSIDNENNFARLMLYLLEWPNDRERTAHHQEILAGLDWRSEDEFLGYLVKVLQDQVAEENATTGWETLSEKSWLAYVLALKHRQKGDLKGAETLLRQSILDASTDEWSYFLGRAELEQLQLQQFSILANRELTVHYESSVTAFSEKERKARTEKERRQSELRPLLMHLSQKNTKIEAKRQTLEKILSQIPEDRKLLVNLAFLAAAEADWQGSLEFLDRFIQQPGRESAARLKSGLLQAEALYLAGDLDAAQSTLETYYHQTSAPWYRTIAEILLEKDSFEALKERAYEHPEYLITAYTATALWAEGKGDKETAIEFYKGALGTYLDNWVEYDLALERIRRLRNERSQ